MNAAVRALMAGAIDYAGLFPPAGLTMQAAVANFASYRGGPNAWMLGRFVVPVARLEEFVAAFAALPAGAANANHHASAANDDRSPWPLSVIARASDAAALAAFNGRYGSRARIDTIEAPPGAGADIVALTPLATMYSVFVEVGWAGDPAPMIASLAALGLMAKLRTGGVAAEAFPPPQAVSRFILACRAAGVPFKATAGLHHLVRAEYPLTYEPWCARATMYGFMNVLVASVAAGVGATAAELAAVLDERGAAITFEEGRVRVGSHDVDAAAIATARHDGMRSFGSCSFDEPVAELTERGLL